MVCPSLSVAISNLETPPLSDNIETVFAFGGSSVYSEVLGRSLCDRIYMTEILAVFPADVFFPKIDTTIFSEIEDPSVPKGILEENGVKFRFKVYERTAVS
jgi:dihydrofolate reductase